MWKAIFHFFEDTGEAGAVVFAMLIAVFALVISFYLIFVH